MTLFASLTIGHGRQSARGIAKAVLNRFSGAAFGLLCLLSLLLFCAAPQAQAQTVVSDAIAADAHWTLANSPYLVTGDVMVQNGATLTIDAGVTVYMGANASLTVQVGAIRATGTTTSIIRVLSDKTRQGQAAAPGDWNQWIFTAGTVNTQLDHVLFEHGKGMTVNAAAPVFNYLNLRNHNGAAITVDLAASPAGIGNQASGNTLNGIAVPAGDIAANVKWGLRGIPYVVTSGTVSVGASPSIQGVSPNTVEQGQTLTLTINGARLDGISKAAFDKAGLTLTPFSGGSANQIFVQVKVDSNATIGAANLEMQVDAGVVTLANAISVTQPMAVITGISPTTILAGAGDTEVTLNGRNFNAGTEVLFNAAAVPTRVVSATELRATLPNQTVIGTLQAQVRWPDALQPGKYLLSNQLALAVQAPVPPTVSIEPTPIALPPDSKPRNITIRLSKADYHANTLTFSVSDPSKATVTPSVIIPAGQTTAQVTITPLGTGTVSLIADSSTLPRISVPVFITADFRGANTAYAAAVGVNLLSNSMPATRQVTLVNANVGVAVGAVLTSVSPPAWTVATKPTITIRGAGIPANAQIAVVPNTGITLGAVMVSGDGAQLSVALDTAADAPVGPRKLVVKDPAGKELVFADPASATVQLVGGLPQIASIDPLFGTRDSTIKLVVQGRYLQQGQVLVLPDTGIRVDAAPQVSADGTTLTAYLQIAADAPTGNRVIQIVTPAGATTATASAANTLSVVSSISGVVSPIMSPLVGVMVGDGGAVPKTNPFLVNAMPVGVLLGSGVREVVPSTAVIGTDVNVTVRGTGLQGVSAASLIPSTGVTMLGAPSVNQLGTELTFTVRVDASAAIGTRRLVLTAANGPVTFSTASGANFLISARIPELDSVAPQVLQTGQAAVKMTVRGRNFVNVSGARVEPAQGITVTGPFETNADATALSFSVAVAAGAAVGDHTVIVTSAAGDSTTVQQPGNTVHVASQIGATYPDLLSPVVGVLNGIVSVPPTRVDGTLASPSVGVMVGSGPGPQSTNRSAASALVGVIVGSGAQAVSPGGWLQGASGNITVSGRDLESVTTVSATPATGLLLGTPIITESGTQLTVSISVAPDAPRVSRGLRLSTATGADITFADPAAARFGIGSLPNITSMSPIVLAQGKSSSLVVRGTNLKDVTGLGFLLGSGVYAGPDLSWSQDALGELLTVSIYADPDAALGNRVVRFDVPGGSTTTAPTPSNTINVVAQ